MRFQNIKLSYGLHPPVHDYFIDLFLAEGAAGRARTVLFNALHPNAQVAAGEKNAVRVSVLADDAFGLVADSALFPLAVDVGKGEGQAVPLEFLGEEGEFSVGEVVGLDEEEGHFCVILRFENDIKQAFVLNFLFQLEFANCLYWFRRPALRRRPLALPHPFDPHQQPAYIPARRSPHRHPHIHIFEGQDLHVEGLAEEFSIKDLPQQIDFLGAAAVIVELFEQKL